MKKYKWKSSAERMSAVGAVRLDLGPSLYAGIVKNVGL
jgi:hypothetical protein